MQIGFRTGALAAVVVIVFTTAAAGQTELHRGRSGRRTETRWYH